MPRAPRDAQFGDMAVFKQYQSQCHLFGKTILSWRKGRLGSKARQPRLHSKTAFLLSDNQRSQGMNSGLKKTKANLLGLEGQFSKYPVFFSYAPLIFLYNSIPDPSGERIMVCIQPLPAVLSLGNSKAQPRGSYRSQA